MTTSLRGALSCYFFAATLTLTPIVANGQTSEEINRCRGVYQNRACSAESGTEVTDLPEIQRYDSEQDVSSRSTPSPHRDGSARSSVPGDTSTRARLGPISPKPASVSREEWQPEPVPSVTLEDLDRDLHSLRGTIERRQRLPVRTVDGEFIRLKSTLNTLCSSYRVSDDDVLKERCHDLKNLLLETQYELWEITRRP